MAETIVYSRVCLSLFVSKKQRYNYRAIKGGKRGKRLGGRRGERKRGRIETRERVEERREKERREKGGNGEIKRVSLAKDVNWPYWEHRGKGLRRGVL